MKKNPTDVEDEHELQILKAVAQAWHAHSSSTSNPKSTNEYDAHRLNFKSRPSRFKLEARSSRSLRKLSHHGWDFGESLWDSYEIVSVSKKLEAGLVLDHQLSDEGKIDKKRKESSNSLRNLISRPHPEDLGKMIYPE